jgi:ribonuclease P protein component
VGAKFSQLVARAGESGSVPETGAGSASAMQRLRQRTHFLAAATGVKASATGFLLQAQDRREDGPVRVGFTVSRKVGNAVVRNRVRRRLKEIVRLAPPERMRPGYDYVLIGRRAALDLPFARLAEDFDRALERVHATARPHSDGTGRTVRRTGRSPNTTPHAGSKQGPT